MALFDALATAVSGKMQETVVV